MDDRSATGKVLVQDPIDVERFGILRYGRMPDGKFKVIEEVDEDGFLKEFLKTMDSAVMEMVIPHDILRNKAALNDFFRTYAAVRQLAIWSVKIGMDRNKRNTPDGKTSFNDWMNERSEFLEKSVKNLKNLIGLK